MRNCYNLNFTKLLTVLGLGLLLSNQSSAQFSACYDIPLWSLNQVNGGNGSVNTSGAPASIILTGPNSVGANAYTHYSITVPATGVISFNWNVSHSDPNYDGFGYSVNGVNTQLTSTTASGTTNVNVVIGDVFTFYGHTFDGCCGTFNATITNFVHPSCCDELDVITEENIEVCTGDGLMTTLEVSSINGGTISWDNGITNGTGFTAPAGTTTYTATSTDINDCSYSVDVVKLTTPTVTAMADNTSPCSGSYVTFNGGGATTYVWDNGVTDNVPAQVTGLGFVTYTVTGHTQWCSDQESVTIDIQDQPTVNAIASDNEICIGETITLSSSGDALTYTWGSLVTEGATLAPTTTTTYNCTGTDAFGCKTTTGVTVVVHNLPTVSAGPDLTACQNTDVTLSGLGANTYTWNNGVTNGVAFSVTAVGPTTYTVTGTDVNGCQDTDQITVTGVEAPVVTGVVENEINGFDGSIDITATGGTGNYDYTWSHGYTTEDVWGLQDQTYTVTVFDGNCSTSESFTLINILGLDVNNLSFNVYPNPATEYIVINADKNVNYTIYDAAGNVILSGQSINNNPISIADLSNGVYVVKMQIENEFFTTQIVKQ